MTVFLLPPESEQLEYKREFNSSGEKKRLLRTVVAFANGKGGKIIIGVDNASRTVSGLPPETDISRLTDAVTNSIADNCTPQVAYKIRVEILDEKPVVVLDVFPGAFTPYYLKELGPDQGTFIRTGATTRLADIYRLTELRFSGSRRTFDTTVVSGAPAVTPTRLKALCRALYAEARQNAETLALPPPKAPTPAILQDWKLISSNNGDVLPHYGFELLEGTCRAVPGSAVRCGLFLGEDRTDIRDTKVFSGPLIEQYHQTVDWLTSKLEVRTMALKDEKTASMMVLSEESRRMQEMMRMYGMTGMDASMFGSQAALVLNVKHPLVKYIFEHKDSEKVPMFCEQLYDLAMLAHKPLSPEEMTKFISRSNEIMMELTK